MKWILLRRYLLLLLLLGGEQICDADRVSSQLPDWRNAHFGKPVATDLSGSAVPSLTASLSVGSRGPILLQDTNFIDHMSHFDRERIPQRVAHPKGAGAFGYFEVTHDITKYTKARVFSHIGKRTQVSVRFSRSTGEKGSPETDRDTRGMALKFQTENGTWDMTNLSTETFFVEDPIFFPSVVHASNRNPQTGVADNNMFWDFMSLRSESTLTILQLQSDRGIPDGYRHLNYFSVNPFKMVNSAGNAVYVKFHWTTNQGVKHLNNTMATIIAGVDQDYFTRDLYNSIADNNFPSWRLWIQVMTFAEAKVYKWNPFDVTKMWFKKDFPLIPVGMMVFNRNPSNYYADVEQIAFSPGNLIPGIEVSPDRLLQGRAYSYPDAARHRLGPNFLHLPVNSAVDSAINSYARDGPGSAGRNGGGAPNYFPNSYNGPFVDARDARQSVFHSPPADVVRSDAEKDDFSQPTIYWNELISEGEKKRLASNAAMALQLVTDENVLNRVLSNFGNVSLQLKSMVVSAMKAGRP